MDLVDCSSGQFGANSPLINLVKVTSNFRLPMSLIGITAPVWFVAGFINWFQREELYDQSKYARGFVP